ncbi:hypothetical protein [Leucobacter triazinivorans]|uniref:Uncharacterized protein n=1 Tax=Leucobacter triazinivorans TaxID=1784719 RepID=A0A4P6KBZ9_9MICO|nr:hypothetical protein [Leucobacter triazinivorans]QBE47757.1 hypothetical protein EVS81_02020 [Leucobacter triazinivorans]
MTTLDPWRIRHGSARTRTSVRGSTVRLLRRLAGVTAAALLAGAALVTVDAAPTEALPRGESVSFSGGLTISNFVMPDGRRAYCIEVSMSEPTGRVTGTQRSSILPGRSGAFSSWGDAAGMRQMNYLIDRHGQSGDAWTAAAVQLTIWRMRENFRSGNAHLNQKIATLQSSQRGRNLIAASDSLYAEAKLRAHPPTDPVPVTAALELSSHPDGSPDRYRVSYPKGTTSLTVVGGTFVLNGASKITVSTGEASTRDVLRAPGAKTVEVTGSWTAAGALGWEPQLDISSTTTAAGAIGQRVAVATGISKRRDATGLFPAVALDARQWAPPIGSSLAQPSAELGGTMVDALIVAAPETGDLRMWPDAEAEFTAYLLPEIGARKYDQEWEPILGEPYDAQAEDPETGRALWTEWWAGADGSALLDAAGERIPVLDAEGRPSSGVAADGTRYPVPLTDAEGAPVLDDDGAPMHAIGRDPVMESRRAPVIWSAEEIAAMSTEERCTAQPVHRQSGIRVPGVGRFSTDPVRVRSGGTIHWVERVESRGAVVHEGRCGVSNETTRIGQPGVVTRALDEAAVGEEIYDVAIISGEFAPDAEYSVGFEAYRAPEADATATAERAARETALIEPNCSAETIVFRSAPVPVDGPGEVRSPGFTARWEHGEAIWWVETLYIDTGDGPEPVHRGECGLSHETTRIGRPAVETEATPAAAAGDLISDIARISGRIEANDAARWELVFSGYRERFAPVRGTESGEPGAEEAAEAPECVADNRLFETRPIEVTAPGAVRSEEVAAHPDWVGSVWWVESLWLVQGEKRILVHEGDCGLANETTVISAPEVATEAVDIVAVGDLIHDTATVSGPLSSRPGVQHEVLFEGYRGDARLTGTDDAECGADNLLFTAGPVPVREVGSVESPGVTALPEYGDTIWWVETLVLRDGDDSVVLHRGRCGLPNETTTVQHPEVRTESAGSATVGEEMYDVAIVSGALSAREDLEFRILFTAYARSAANEMSCDAHSEIADLGDQVGVMVDGPGRYESRRVRLTEKHVGMGGFVETLVMIERGETHVVHVGECGAQSEAFEVRLRESAPLARTGGDPVQPLLGIAAALFLGGACAAGAVALRTRIRRRRRRSPDRMQCSQT